MIWAVLDHDWVSAETTVIATFTTKDEADAFHEEKWGHGYQVVAIPLPSA